MNAGSSVGDDTTSRELLHFVTQQTRFALINNILQHPEQLPSMYELEELNPSVSDAFRDAFENEGCGDSEPDPYLIVGARAGTSVRTYRRSWSDGPRDRDVLRALDETLVSIAEQTPQESTTPAVGAV